MRRTDKENTELKECTFKPHINDYVPGFSNSEHLALFNASKISGFFESKVNDEE